MEVFSLRQVLGWTALVGGGLSAAVAALLFLGPLLGFYDWGLRGPGARSDGSVSIPAPSFTASSSRRARPPALALPAVPRATLGPAAPDLAPRRSPAASVTRRRPAPVVAPRPAVAAPVVPAAVVVAPVTPAPVAAAPAPAPAAVTPDARPEHAKEGNATEGNAAKEGNAVEAQHAKEGNAAQAPHAAKAQHAKEGNAVKKGNAAKEGNAAREPLARGARGHDQPAAKAHGHRATAPAEPAAPAERPGKPVHAEKAGAAKGPGPQASEHGHGGAGPQAHGKD